MLRKFQRTHWFSLAGLGILFLTIISPIQAAPIVTQSYGNSVRGTIDGMSFLLLRGTHAERGQAHGVLAGKEIVNIINSMASFINGSGVLTWSQAITATGSFTYPSRFETEMTAMLDGIKQALPNATNRKIAALNREISLQDLKVLMTGDLFELAKCSQFSAWGNLTADGSVIIGRNWDYPNIFPMSAATILAVQPSESGLKDSIDAVWFGMIGMGLATLNSDGVYVSGNDGGIDEGGLFGTTPTPGMLILRGVTEAVQSTLAVQDMAAALKNHLVLNLILHISFPEVTNDANTPKAIEYDPRPSGFGTQIRGPEATLPNALILTNHFMLNGGNPSSESVNRYNTIANALKQAKSNSTKLGFNEVRAILNSVAKNATSNNTQYSAVVWPKQRKLMVATAPNPSTSATKGNFVTVEWDAIMNLKATQPGPDAGVDAPIPTKDLAMPPSDSYKTDHTFADHKTSGSDSTNPITDGKKLGDAAGSNALDGKSNAGNLSNDERTLLSGCGSCNQVGNGQALGGPLLPILIILLGFRRSRHRKAHLE